MRLCAPDGAVRQTDVAGRRYSSSNGMYEVTHPAAVKAMLGEGFTVASATHGPASKGGFVCPDCGFHAFLKTCSRCGATCTREGTS